MIRINNKQLSEELALERRKVIDLTGRMSKMEAVVSGIEVKSVNDMGTSGGSDRTTRE